MMFSARHLVRGVPAAEVPHSFSAASSPYPRLQGRRRQRLSNPSSRQVAERRSGRKGSAAITPRHATMAESGRATG